MPKSDELSAVNENWLSVALDHFLNITHSSALAFLIGAGCSRCAGLPLTNELTDKVIEDDKIGITSKEILLAVRSKFEGGVDPILKTISAR